MEKKKQDWDAGEEVSERHARKKRKRIDYEGGAETFGDARGGGEKSRGGGKLKKRTNGTLSPSSAKERKRERSRRRLKGKPILQDRAKKEGNRVQVKLRGKSVGLGKKKGHCSPGCVYVDQKKKKLRHPIVSAGSRGKRHSWVRTPRKEKKKEPTRGQSPTEKPSDQDAVTEESPLKKF